MAWDCVIVGAGMSGLLAARWLHETGLRVLVIDKGWQVGGRLASRRVGAGVCDHGAPCLEVSDARFARLVSEWQCAGLVRPLRSPADASARPPAGAPGHPVGSPAYQPRRSMSAFARALAEGLSVHSQERVLRLTATEDAWEVFTDWQRTYQTPVLILTAPLPQSLALLEGAGRGVPANVLPKLSAVRYNSAFMLVVAMTGPTGIPEPGCVWPGGQPIRALADNRALAEEADSGPIVTVETTPEFARDHWDDDDGTVTRLILEAARPYLGGHAGGTQLKRWRHRMPVNPLNELCMFWSDAPALGLAGDAFGPCGAQSAALSGLGVAERLIESEIESIDDEDD